MTLAGRPFFVFSALNAQGRLVTGYVRAANRRQARKLLLVEHPDLLAVRRCWVWPWKTQKMRRELILFLNALTSLTAAGLRVVDSLDILSTQWEGTGRQKIQTIRRALENGLRVEEAFALAWPFDRACHALLHAAQETGDLHTALSQIHTHLSGRETVRAHFHRAVRYPLLVAGVMVGCCVVLCKVFLPPLVHALQESSTHLPLSTQVLVFCSWMVETHGEASGMGVAGAWVGGIMGWRFWPGFRLCCEKIFLRTPGFGPLALAFAWGEFFSLWHSLTCRGIPILHGLEVSGKSLPWRCLAHVVTIAQCKVREGRSLTEGFRGGMGLGAFVSPLLSVAESTGNLGPLLKQISIIYEKMSTTQQERLIPLIEPLCLIVLGGMLLFVVWGTLVPLYDHVLTQPLPV